MLDWLTNRSTINKLAAKVAELEQGKNVTQLGQAGWQAIANGPLGIPASEIFQPASAEKLSGIYSKTAIVYACVREIATTAAEAPLQIGTEDEEGNFEPVDNELSELFYDNPWYSYNDLINLMVSRLQLTGASFVMEEKFKNRLGTGALLPLPTHIVKQKAVGPNVVGYEIRSGDSTMHLDADEMVPLKYFNPSTFTGYSSPLATAMKDLIIDDERLNLTAEVLRNRDVPHLMFKTETNLGREQRKAFADSVRENLGSEAGNRGKTIVLPNGVVVEKGDELTDIDFSMLASLDESRICMAFQVPPILIGSYLGISKSTYSNYSEARRSFYAETMNPLWAFLASGFTRSLIDDSTNLVFRFDTSEIQELQEDLNDVAVRARELFQSQIINRTEARRMMRLGPDYEPDEDMIPIVITTPTPLPVDEEGKIYAKAEAAIGGFPASGQLEDTMIRVFRAQQDAVVDAISKSGDLDWVGMGNEAGLAIFETLYDIARRSAKQLIRESEMRLAVKTEGKEVETEGAFDVVDRNLEARMREQSIILAESSTNTTAKIIEKAITQTREGLVAAGVTGTNTIPALTQAVQQAFEGMEEWRARRIAITESSRAVHDARIITGMGSPDVVAGFNPVISGDACELCQAYDSNNQPTSTPLYGWTSVEDANAQVGQYDNRTLPPYHPNCRCTIEPIIIGVDPLPEGPSKQKLTQRGTQV